MILVELDFPRRTKLDETTQKQNRKLASMFGVRGYPTIWFVNPEIIDDMVNKYLKVVNKVGGSILVFVGIWMFFY